MVDTDSFLDSFKKRISDSKREGGHFSLTPEELVSVSAVFAYRDMRDQLDSVGAVPALVRVPFDDYDRTSQVPSYRIEKPAISFDEFVASIAPSTGFGKLLGAGLSFSTVSSDESASIKSSTAFYYALGRVVVFSRRGMECYLARLREAKMRLDRYLRETSGVYLPVRNIRYDPQTDWSPVIRNMDDFFDQIKYVIVAMNYIIRLHRYLRLFAHESFLHRIHSASKPNRRSGGKRNVGAQI
jgi:hypothetical protein